MLLVNREGNCLGLQGSRGRWRTDKLNYSSYSVPNIHRILLFAKITGDLTSLRASTDTAHFTSMCIAQCCRCITRNHETFASHPTICLFVCLFCLLLPEFVCISGESAQDDYLMSKFNRMFWPWHRRACVWLQQVNMKVNDLATHFFLCASLLRLRQHTYLRHLWCLLQPLWPSPRPSGLKQRHPL